MTCVWDDDMNNKCQKMHGMFMIKKYDKIIIQI